MESPPLLQFNSPPAIVACRPVTVFVTPPSLAELRRRLENRNTEKREDIELRLQNALREIPEYVHYQYLVVNDRLEDAVRDLVEIHDVERRRVARLSPRY